jgi:hypothetical protein
LSSDTARPIIATAVTTESGAALGPGEHHAMSPYSPRAGGVKAIAWKAPRRLIASAHDVNSLA